MRRKIALLCIMLPLLTCQLHAQEVNDDEEDNTEETTKVSSLLMPNAFSPNGDGINDIYKPKDGYRNIEEFHAYIYIGGDRSSMNGPTLPRDGMAPTAEKNPGFQREGGLLPYLLLLCMQSGGGRWRCV